MIDLKVSAPMRGSNKGRVNVTLNGLPPLVAMRLALHFDSEGMEDVGRLIRGVARGVKPPGRPPGSEESP